jgi:hypothetical protein
MTGLIPDLGPDSYTLSGSQAQPPNPANDNQPGIKGAQGFMGLLLRRSDEGYEILLCHREPGLSKRVETADDDADIIALWRGIGRKLNLPLFAETSGGDIVQIEPNPVIALSPRRRGSQMAYRRPRFLARRKVGQPVVEPQPIVQIQR